MKLETRAAKAQDLPQIKRLIDEYIAEDYYSLEELEKLLYGDRNLFYAVTDADEGDGLIAFFYGFLSPLDEALPLLHVSERPEPLRQYDGNTLVGVYKLACTQKAYQKYGICSSFIRDLEPVFRERGAKMILATALRPLGREAPMRNIFRNYGFTAVSVISRPWVAMTLYCPYCKQHHCICDAVFYIKKLDGCPADS